MWGNEKIANNPIRVAGSYALALAELLQFLVLICELGEKASG